MNADTSVASSRSRARLPFPPAWPALALAGLLLAACGSRPVAENQPTSPPGKTPIESLGRLEPGDGVVSLGARSLTGQPSIVGRLFVDEGDPVKVGQVVCELNSKGQLAAAVQAAEARIALARARLAQVQTGAKPADVAAQRDEVDRLRHEYENAQRELTRNQGLAGDVVPPSQIDQLKLRVDTASKAMLAAEQRLASLSEIRPVDVEVARAEVAAAERDATLAQAELDAAILRSPLDGHVIRVHARAGEEVGSEGVLEVAVLDPMYAVAEVPESDLPRVKVGQHATISGDGLAQPVSGTVERIGLKVLQNSLMPLDPATFSDSRVVEVRVRIDTPAAVANLVHLRVTVLIQP